MRSRRRGRRIEADDLWTLYALQGGVSRRNYEKREIGNYGQGTANMIQMFQDLGGDRIARPKMCVLSGSTLVLFDGRYRMVEKNGSRIIAFNRRNDLRKPPDSRCVRHLEHYFPGTLISMRFMLDRGHLSEISRRAS